MPFSKSQASARVQRLHRGETAPVVPLKDLFSVPPPAEPRDPHADDDLWLEWRQRTEAHGSWCHMWALRARERDKLNERIQIGQQAIAEDPLNPHAIKWRERVASLRQQRDKLEAQLEVWDEIVTAEADHLAAIEEALRNRVGAPASSYVCGTCQRIVSSIRDHDIKCREGWKRLIKAYSDATGTPLQHIEELDEASDVQPG